MDKYRKRAILVDVVRWNGDNLKEVIDFTGLHPSAEKWTWEEYETVVRQQGLKIFTQEGPLLAAIGDYILRGHSPELGYHFWPVKPDYFQQAYEKWEPFSEFDKLRDDALGR